MYERYAALRDQAGETDYSVAKAIGIYPSTLAEWKRGTYTPKLDKLKLIADHFGVTLDYLAGGE